MKINEIFYSIEGEGRRIGQPTIFVRTQGCLLHCPHCDTPESHNMLQGVYMTPAELAEQLLQKINEVHCTAVEFTGGMPELHIGELMKTMEIVENARDSDDMTWIFQATGIMDLNFVRERFANTVFAYDYKSCYPFAVGLSSLTDRDEVKFVIDVEDKDNYERAQMHILSLLNASQNVHIIVTSMSKVDKEELWKELTERLLTDRQWKFYSDRIHILPRLQMLYWNNERGR